MIPAALLVLALSGEARPTIAGGLAWYGLPAAVDIASTEYALRNPANREGNPLIQTPGARSLYRFGTAALCVLAEQTVLRDHKGLRWAARITWAVVGGLSALHNVRTR